MRIIGLIFGICTIAGSIYFSVQYAHQTQITWILSLAIASVISLSAFAIYIGALRKQLLKYTDIEHDRKMMLEEVTRLRLKDIAADPDITKRFSGK